MLRDPVRLLAGLRVVHERIRDQAIRACERQATEHLAAVVAHEGGDVVYAIDRISEKALVAELAEFARDWSCVLVAEGLGASGMTVLPAGCVAEDADVRLLVDPIDGTRGLMYDKRSGWILTGVAPNRGNGTTLADIEVAIQTEIPVTRQYLCDTLWAIAGHGADGERYNRLTGERRPLRPRPSGARTIAHGFGAVHRVGPGPRGELAVIDDALVERLLGPPPAGGPPLVFEDQYISVGGQLYELMMGHDRWIADLRPLVARLLASRGIASPSGAHPYDLASELVAREAGVIVTDPAGRRLMAPLDVTTDVAWVACANAALADQVGGALRKVLAERGVDP